MSAFTVGIPELLSSLGGFDRFEKLSSTFSDLHKTLFWLKHGFTLHTCNPLPCFHSFARVSEVKRSRSSQSGECQLHPRSRSPLSSAKNMHNSFSTSFFFWTEAMSTMCHLNRTDDTSLTVTHRTNTSVRSILKIKF